MRQKSKILHTVAILVDLRLLPLLAFLAIGTAACDKAEPPAPPLLEVAVLQVQPRDIPIYLEMVGQTRGSVSIPIRARVDGVLEEMHFLEGRPVSKDQLLYVIDPSPYQAQVVEAEGRLAQARTNMAKARSDLDRIKPLAEIDAVSKQDLDAAVAQYKAARGAVQAAEAQLEQAEIRLGYTRIHAPVAGLIGITKAKVGEYVGREPNPVVLNYLSQTDPIRVRFSINEREYLRFSREFAAEMSEMDGQQEGKADLQMILADGTIHDHTGKVVNFDAAVDPATGTLTLEADFPNPDRLVLPGQFARVRAVVEERKAALAVPQKAVMETQGLFQLAVIDDDDTVELRQVEMGPRVEREWIVEAGLQAGERIALEGLQRLRTGMKVIPAEAPAETNRQKE
jgi:membrane fusion protein (multidrug efflux system)